LGEARPYRSPRRAAHATATRAAILQAARRRFAADGYAATPVSAIAEEAGVSVPTVYASVGSKAKVALALIDLINEEADMPALDRAQQEAATPAELLRANARLTRVLAERCGDIMQSLISAAATEPEVEPALARGREYHRAGQQAVVGRLDAMGALRDEVPVDEAGAVLTAITLPEVVANLVLDEGWTYERVEGWLYDAARRLLMRPEVGD
jgi:AcrR family transcriptional regulator